MHPHFAALYQDQDVLIPSVAEYAASALKGDGAFFLIATPAHRNPILESLKGSGLPVRQLLEEGRLVALDAQECLDGFLVEGMPDRDRFFGTVGSLVQQTIRNHLELRAFGEMVNLLSEQGAHEAAFKLEQLWNELAEEAAFSLYCAYRLNPFSPAIYRGKLQELCRVHNRLVLTEDANRFDAVVGQALVDVLGPAAASRLSDLPIGGETLLPAAIPRGATLLLRLREQLPTVTDAVLMRAQALYQS